MIQEFAKKGVYTLARTPSRRVRWAIAALTLLCMFAAALVVPAHDASAAQADTLEPGMNLTVGQSLVSLNGSYTLQMQGDGNLVLVNTVSGVAIWATGTARTGAVRLSMQLDGNLVLYTVRNIPVWESNTGSGRSQLRLQNDRNLVIYKERGGPVWASNTAVPTIAPPSQRERPKNLSWPTLYAGDCEMRQATITFNSDGTGTFGAWTLTNHTHSGDVWHMHIYAEDRDGVVLFDLPKWDSVRMDEHDPHIETTNPGDYVFFKQFQYNADFFHSISKAEAYYNC